MNHLLLASSTTPPVEIAAWLGCLAFMTMLAVNLFKISDRIRGKAPQPPNAQLATAIKTMEARVSGVEKQITETRDEVRGNREQNEALIAAQTAMFNQALKELERRMGDKQEDIPEKIVNLLRNTKGLL